MSSCAPLLPPQSGRALGRLSPVARIKCRWRHADRRVSAGDHRYRRRRIATVLNKLFADVSRFSSCPYKSPAFVGSGRDATSQTACCRLYSARSQGHALGVIAMGQRNTGVGRDGRRRRNAGNHGTDAASAAACNSSPRPKINGSPPFRRTTVLPAFAAATSIDWCRAAARVLAGPFADRFAPRHGGSAREYRR